jgi:hypothetical protein
MSASGQTRQFRDVSDMSGLPPTSDVSRPGRHFAFVPEGDIADAPQLSPTTSSSELPSCEVAS